MNSLNSVLYEGVLITDPEKINESGNIHFTVESKRTYKNQDDKNVNEIMRVDVITNGRLAEVVLQYLAKGRGVRIVGRMSNMLINGNNTIGLVAEHIEFKPEYSKEVCK